MNSSWVFSFSKKRLSRDWKRPSRIIRKSVEPRKMARPVEKPASALIPRFGSRSTLDRSGVKLEVRLITNRFVIRWKLRVTASRRIFGVMITPSSLA